MLEKILDSGQHLKKAFLPVTTSLGLLVLGCVPMENRPTSKVPQGKPAEVPSKVVDTFSSVWIDVNNDKEPDAQIVVIGVPNRITASDKAPYDIDIGFSPGTALETCFRKRDLESVAQRICDEAGKFRDLYQQKGRDSKGNLIYLTVAEQVYFNLTQPDPTKLTYTFIRCENPPDQKRGAPVGPARFGTFQCNE
ncbi:MAG: hypothetical protein ACD_30C00017G0007 [uncultured bacterium]|uniref:Lipoprotein n=4 Tax=Candidatus Daviesiibacteriota TaxID=1752718 RepID=A0A0G0HBP5_9BACT|nr:MAG: hypothetical protein ACD_30C00017G0007 [uncultured bacterium]KKQ09529.1 MAG: hypothetical protein US19_C0013G0003 [Candidatus Daviesbacteria bacterium GW2011_GWB1_36_5]KKQ15585.1 MAG: hypothetical protein US28_C0014G0028 [Candidatus Daviesbacteria bacterium GW2011_GWA1_36_8]OGE17524.1 MAG: hypothetical protein A2858_01325 [Candidatus Daviesbacteria bacterium RIFCSPHIGHO2_01_FULL_36_37]OGE36618.1 MAG: hypothetical protein A3E66_03170 [Candidatus Daviesbacteria bacterium RIFCSPHIGHO2_12_F